MSDMVSYMVKSASQQMLSAMVSNMGHAAEYAKTLDIEERVLLETRLYPDMLPLIRQVQIAGETAARGAARIAQLDMPEFEDTETSFSELQTRLNEANAFVQGIDNAVLDANEMTEMEIPLGPMTVNWTGREYLSTFVLPNLYFHASITFALLRQAGMRIGKREFLMAT